MGAVSVNEGPVHSDDHRRRVRVITDVVVLGVATVMGLGAVGLAGWLGGGEWGRGVLRAVVLLLGGGTALWFISVRSRFDPNRPAAGLMAPRGGWLAAATPTEDGIRFPGYPPRHGCDLVVRASGAVLVTGTTAVDLEWDEFRVWPGPFLLRPAIPDPGNEGDSWSVAPFSATEGEGPIGIGIEVTGRYIDEVAPLLRRRHTWRNRLGRATLPGVRVALASTWSIDARLDAERATVAALCQLLAERPEVRRRLDEPERVRQLLDDLVRRPLGRVAEVDPVRRHPFEINAALRRLGYVHRFNGRPLPDDLQAERHVVIDRVTHELRTNPYTRDLHIEPSQIQEVLGQRYLLEPWPFAALLD